MLGIKVEVSLTFFKSVSQFDTFLIVSQMLIIDETLYELYIEKTSRGTTFSVFQFTPVAVPFSAFSLSHTSALSQLLSWCHTMAKIRKFKMLYFQNEKRYAA